MRAKNLSASIRDFVISKSMLGEQSKIAWGASQDGLFAGMLSFPCKYVLKSTSEDKDFNIFGFQYL